MYDAHKKFEFYSRCSVVVSFRSAMMPSVTAQPRCIASQTLTTESFRSFGSVIENPGSPTWNAVSANQGSAVKYPDISLMDNAYHEAQTGRTARPSTSLFVCSPRNLEDNVNVPSSQGLFQLSILERHPFTTQTFVPLGLDPAHAGSTYLVVVAPSRSKVGSEGDLPDMDNVKAFVACGSQAVTYGRGIWHAPMVVIGKKPVTFVVTQFVNGVPQDDCEECTVHSQGSGLQVRVPDLQKLPAKL